MAEAQRTAVRDIPGRLREYETVYILRPDTPEAEIAEVNKRVRAIIDADKGILLQVKNWGRRRLAYEVKKNLRGTYLFFNYLGKATLVPEVERNLRLLEPVIRHYTVKVAENVDPAARTSEVTDETFAQASVPGPDEESIATGQAYHRPYDEEYGGDFGHGGMEDE